MPYIIGISGGSASGKTTVCSTLSSSLQTLGFSVTVVLQDNFYKGLTDQDDPKNYNFDHPDSIDFNDLVNCVNHLKDEKNTNIPIYDFTTHKRQGSILIEPSEIIIVEGIFTFFDERLRNLFDLKLFVEASPEARAFRRMKRDIKERGRTMESVEEQYMRFVKPAYDYFIAPTREYADLLVGNESEHIIGTDVIVDHICNKIKISS